MHTALVNELTQSFEARAQRLENGVEYWLARDLQELLGYSNWQNFTQIIEKAKAACQTVGAKTSHHFTDVSKIVRIGVGTSTTRKIEDIMLTRYACYLIAQNGDPRKSQIAFAQTYVSRNPSRDLASSRRRA